MASVTAAEVATARVGVTAAREAAPVGAAAARMPATSAAVAPTREGSPGDEADRKCGDKRKDLQ